MRKDKKGCFVLLGTMTLVAIGMYICIKLEWVYLKNLLLMSSGFIGALVGDRYFSQKEKRTSKRFYLWAAVGLVVITVLLTWLMEKN